MFDAETVLKSTSSTTTSQTASATVALEPDSFIPRHIGPDSAEVAEMLKFVSAVDLEGLIQEVVPESIRLRRPLNLPARGSEAEILRRLREMAGKNKIYRSFIGMGYYDCVTPPVIQRNILENPGWYTQYTPYQAEIAQGRLEALLTFQTMVADLTAMEVANASMLDEATAAAEAMAMCYGIKGSDSKNKFFIAADCHPQTVAVVKTRAQPLGIEVVVAEADDFAAGPEFFGALVQYPGSSGRILDFQELAGTLHGHDALMVVASDLLALTLIKPPGEFGADIVIGNAQRFGVPLGYGGPHAAFFATRDSFKRNMPGRLVGVSRDAQGSPAYRLSLQTREQHIRREKATSNICTAQALLANMAAMYAVYHGPERLRAIASRVHRHTCELAAAIEGAGHQILSRPFFDTLTIELKGVSAEEIHQRADKVQINLRRVGKGQVGLSMDEVTTSADVAELAKLFGGKIESGNKGGTKELPGWPGRTSEFLTHPVFNTHHSETEMLRYLRRLESRDLSLTSSMIPLGSCTMKLNASAEMFPVSWPEFSRIHPFAPLTQTSGYQQLFSDLEKWLAEITGFTAISLQPNAGSQGEYAGLLAIRGYLQAQGESQRDVCLIPASAHGTNPASAVMAGLTVVGVACDAGGNVDLGDLDQKVKAHADRLAVFMVTYPSTHGVFEEKIKEICRLVHEHGGQVYMDGANMNAQVGLCRPGDIGADVCHLNLHKTFCIPHGGGGPGMGPIGVARHLAPFLPGHPEVAIPGAKAELAVSAAPWGSASILTISWVYIALMGNEGLKQATETAILNANYMAHRLNPYFPVLYRGKKGRVAHECIVDLRKFKAAGVEVEDVAKRLMDYGFHAPTISFPVPGTMMIEPTESESKTELDRFCDAMIAIHGEIMEIQEGKADKQNNLLKNAPHTAVVATQDEWTRPYSRQRAVFPVEAVRQNKFWPPVGRIDNVYGDRNLICSCVGMEAYQ